MPIGPDFDSSVRPFSIEKLNLLNHDRTNFNSGSEPLDQWFRSQAGQQTRSSVATVYVLTETASRKIAGFYTLSATALDASQIDDNIKKKLKLPKYPKLPGILLGRLAVDVAFGGQGLGRLMVAHAIEISQELRSRMGAMALVVDAKDEAARQFYLHFGFLPFQDDKDSLFLPAAAFDSYLQ